MTRSPDWLIDVKAKNWSRFRRLRRYQASPKHPKPSEIGSSSRTCRRSLRRRSRRRPPQLNAAKRFCVCGTDTFIGDYFGLDFGGGYAYTTSVSTYDEGNNPSNYQQQIVARVALP